MASCDHVVTTEHDSKIPGLQIRHLATKSVWYLYYRDRHGKQRKPALGDVRVLNRVRARELALQTLSAVASGQDVQAARANTVSDLWDKYETDWLPRKKAKSQAGDKALWKLHISPALGHCLVDKVRPSEIIALHTSMAATPYQANRVCALLSKMFNLARKWEWRKGDNPVQADRFKESKRRRVPSMDEMRRVLEALQKYPDPYFRGLIEMLVYTGARRSEIMHCRRDWIRDGAIHLPDSKTGEKVIHLSAPALLCVKEIPVTTGNPYLICGRIEGEPMQSPKKAWAIVLKNAKVKDLRLHDLRRFYASTGLSAGLTLDAVGALLGHTSTSTTAGYAYMQTDASKAAADLTGLAIAKAQAA